MSGKKINGNKVQTDYFELNTKLFHGRKARVFLTLFSLTPRLGTKIVKIFTHRKETIEVKFMQGEIELKHLFTMPLEICPPAHE